MAATATTTTTISAIVTPPPSSSSHTLLPSDHSFTLKPIKPSFKPLTLKPNNFTLSPLLLPLHLCHSSSAFNDVKSAVSDVFEENPDEAEEEQAEEEAEENEDEAEVEDEDDISMKASELADDCKLYIGNLSYSMTASQLSEIFAEAGQVKSVEIIYDKVTDRSRGFGFVRMGSNDEAKEAIRLLDGSQVGGRTVRVNFPEVPRGAERNVMAPRIRISNSSFVDTPHKLYAGNLGWGVTTQGLRDAFENQAGFVSAKVIYDRESGRSRGFGFITFSTAEAAQSALTTMNEVELEGRPLRLNTANEKARSNTEAGAEAFSAANA